MIGGNTGAVLQQTTGSATNHLGEKVTSWTDIRTLWGWLDLSGGDSKYTYDAKHDDGIDSMVSLIKEGFGVRKTD